MALPVGCSRPGDISLQRRRAARRQVRACCIVEESGGGTTGEPDRAAPGASTSRSPPPTRSRCWKRPSRPCDADAERHAAGCSSGAGRRRPRRPAPCTARTPCARRSSMQRVEALLYDARVDGSVERSGAGSGCCSRRASSTSATSRTSAPTRPHCGRPALLGVDAARLAGGVLGRASWSSTRSRPPSQKPGSARSHADDAPELLGRQRAAGGQQLEVAGHEGGALLLVAAVDRQRQQLAVGVGVHVARRAR